MVEYIVLLCENGATQRERESEKHMFLINASSFHSSSNNNNDSGRCYGSMSKNVRAYVYARSDSKTALYRFVLYVVH